MATKGNQSADDLFSAIDNFNSPKKSNAGGPSTDLMDKIDGFGGTAQPAAKPPTSRDQVASDSGFDVKHPIISKILDATDIWHRTPADVPNQVNSALSDIGTQITTPIDDVVKPSGDAYADTLAKANESVKRGGRVAKDIATTAFSPISALLSPLNPEMEKVSTAAQNLAKLAAPGATVHPQAINNPIQGLVTPGAVTTGDSNADSVIDEAAPLGVMALLGEVAKPGLKPGTIGPETVDAIRQSKPGTSVASEGPPTSEALAKRPAPTPEATREANAAYSASKPVTLPYELKDETGPTTVEGTPEQTPIVRKAEGPPTFKEIFGAEPEQTGETPAAKATRELADKERGFSVEDKRRVKPQESEANVSASSTPDLSRPAVPADEAKSLVAGEGKSVSIKPPSEAGTDLQPGDTVPPQMLASDAGKALKANLTRRGLDFDENGIVVAKQHPDADLEAVRKASETPSVAGKHVGYATDGKPVFDFSQKEEATDRRQNPDLRQRIEQMSPEEKDAEITRLRKERVTSDVTGLPNRRAFDEAGKAPAVAMSDADGLKALNDKFGYDAGNALLKAKAEALQEAGLDAYHEKGDEYLYRGNSPEELQQRLDKAREILRNRIIRVETANGNILRFKGADFSYGTGQDLATAETGLKSHKATREAAGERARGELRGITEVGSENGEVNQRGAETKTAVTADTSLPKSRADQLKAQLGERGNLVGRARSKNVQNFIASLKPEDATAIKSTGLKPDDFWREVRKKPGSPAENLTPTEKVAEPVKTSAPASEAPKMAEAGVEQEPPKYTGAQSVGVKDGGRVAGVDGKAMNVSIPGNEKPMAAKYRVVESDALTPSHSGVTFAPNDAYPVKNDRQYHTDKAEQAKVIKNEQQYDPAQTVNTNPTSETGPPIVTPGGKVLGGNSRAMTLQRLYGNGRGDLYKNYLADNAQTFGLDSEKIKGMKQPVLVREVEAPKTVGDTERAITEYNRSSTAALNPTARAVALGKKLTEGSVREIAGMLDDLSSGDKSGSVADLLRERPQQVIDILRRDGALAENEVNGLVEQTPSGLKFTDAGKDIISDALLGHWLGDADLVSRMAPALKAKLESVLSEGLQLKGRGEDPWNLTNTVKQAIDDTRMAAKSGMSVDDYYKQGGMFGTSENPLVEAMAKKLTENQKAVKASFRQFLQDAKMDVPGQGMLGLIQKVEPGQAFSDAFGGSSLGEPAFNDAATRAWTERNGGGSATLAAHTPFSVAKIVLDNLNRFWHEKVADPLIERGLKIGRRHPEVEKADAVLADNLRQYENAPQYLRAKAEAIVRKVVGKMSRGQERLFVMLADKQAREYLEANHPAEYQQALSDPEIQAALKRYKPYEQQLTAARQALGGAVLGDDYLKRVYDEYTSGIGKKAKAGEGMDVSYDRIRPQKADKFSREKSAEHYYQNGLHEFGPSFGTKYVGTMLKVARDRVARDFLSKSTLIQPDDYLPHSVQYNGKTYYDPEVAADLRRQGQKGVEAYARYQPTPKGDIYLGPKQIVDAMNRLDVQDNAGVGGVRRFLREQTVGLGFGVPHMWNIMRRVAQTAPMGVANPLGWARAFKVLLDSNLKARGVSGVEDPTFDRLARYGGISTSSEISAFKKYAGGNLNPANWLQPLAKVGHDWLFKPGGMDQRARLYVADLVKSQHPQWADSKITQAVNEQLGNYSRANWTETQRSLGRFMLFPGWDMSSVNWVLRHPVKTAVPPALLVWTANQVIGKLGGNREADRNDLFAIHVGDRSITPGFLNEPLARVVGGAPLRGVQALLDNKTASRAAAEAVQGIPRDLSHLTNMIRPDLSGVISLVANRERLGTNKEIFKPGDFTTPGHILPNTGIEKTLIYALQKALPQFERATSGDKFDLVNFVGGNLGLYNYAMNGEDRLKRKMGLADEYSRAKSSVVRSGDQQAMEKMYRSDPDSLVYLALRPAMEEQLKKMSQIDEAKGMVQSGKYSDEQKKQAVEKLDQYRQQEAANADLLDRGVDRILRMARDARDRKKQESNSKGEL